MLIRSFMKRHAKQWYALLLLLLPAFLFAQTFTPVTVTGFNNDVVAETGTSSLTTTTISLDGPTVSNKVMYTNTFKTLNSFGGGGIPDNGLITDATGNTYQMASFNANNALLLQRTQSGDLVLSTPSKFTKVRILCLSTEGTSLVNGVMTFSDGSTTNAFTNYSLGDWFNNTTNLVLSGFGRCTRATPASGADAYPTNPRLYYIEIPLSCTDRQKTLQKITFTNVTTGGSNAPFPNAVFFGISGIGYTQNISAAITNATCTSNGSATLTITGSGSPYTVTWNTTPVQTGVTATNLAAGNYTATITDANSCISTYPVTITAPAPLTMTAHADTSICPGASFNANTVSNATTFSWSPTAGVSNAAIANPVLSPASTTTYTVTGTSGSCTISKSFTVTVLPAVTLTVHADTAICSGTSFNANTVSNATTFLWTPATGLSSAAIASPIVSPTTTTPYTVKATTGNCSITKSFTVTVNPAAAANAGNTLLIFSGQSITIQASASAGSYLWTPSTGLSSATVLQPVASPSASTTYTLKVTSAQGCTATSSVLVTVVNDCVKVMEAFTPNGDGFNDKWIVTNGGCTTKVSARVYNRWGGKVFESNDYKNDWDGTYNGKPLPDGTYYYVVHFDLINSSAVDKKGNVTILR
ncbi:MAG: gliding motility-associated C-terminal domain-containing protein [Bacteroidetes bacterium]|nr:gliding motility-associated C-terminal domain-containing protein [Bacteroidota bacterium]